MIAEELDINMKDMLPLRDLVTYQRGFDVHLLEADIISRIAI